jgi:hypothetical protein
MKKVFFTLLITIMLSACGTAYNSQLKQVELGMSEQQITALMGDKYTAYQNDGIRTLEYKDRYKNHWFFQFDENNKLTRWYKETE